MVLIYNVPKKVKNCFYDGEKLFLTEADCIFQHYKETMYETILHFAECRKILKNTIHFLSVEAIPLTQKHFLKKTAISFLIKVLPF